MAEEVYYVVKYPRVNPQTALLSLQGQRFLFYRLLVKLLAFSH